MTEETTIVATDATTTTTNDQQPQETHWFVKHLLSIIPYFLSFAEAGVFVFEFLMINTMISLALQHMSFYSENAKRPTAVYSCIEAHKSASWIDIVKCILRKDALVILANGFHVFTWACLTCTYFIWRYKIDFKRMRRIHLSKTALLVVLISICGVISLYSIQQRTDRWIYSTSNLEKNVTLDMNGNVYVVPPSLDDSAVKSQSSSSLMNDEEYVDEKIEKLFKSGGESNDDDDEETNMADLEASVVGPLKTDKKVNETEPFVVKQFVDYGRVFHLLFGAPLIEEVVLRIALTTVIQRRLGTVISSIVWTNVIFSSLHIVNALHNASNSYTMFQVFAGFILGTFYSTRLYITGNLFESLALHILNNMAAIWIPITITWTDIFPHFSFPLFATQTVYILLLIKDILYIRQAHKNYDNVAPTVSSEAVTATPSPAVTESQAVTSARIKKNKGRKNDKSESKKNK